MEFKSMPELKDVVEKVKGAFQENLAHIESDKILYASFSKKESDVAAKIGKIPPKYSIFLNDHDYLLEVHRETWLASSVGEKLYIILHELCHVPHGGFDPKSKQHRKVIKHDIEDFKSLVREYGVDLENIKKLEDLIN